MTPFTERVVEIIGHIPEGTVMTYGQIAAMAGHPKAARQVVFILNHQRSKDLPWHRIINREGKIALKDPEGAALQKHLLEKEGIYVSEDLKVDLKIYQHLGW